MKVILSRKGFDSENGAYPSPILPNGQMISVPIPDQNMDDIKYSDVKTGELTCYDLMKCLNPKIKSGNKRLEIDEDTKCHLDPDIYRKAIGREPNWKPLFGQVDAAQGHLRKQKVSEDDLFLFFGWFRKTRYDDGNDGKLVFDPIERDLHTIFGYLQIGEITKVDHEFDAPKWMKYHPHTKERYRNNKTNTIYIARDDLSWNEAIPGAGRFMFNDKLILTKKGLSRSKWDLPDCFKEAEISYHKHSWKDGYFKSADKGQEFVIKDNDRIEEWAMNKIEGSQIDY
jgi:hypothetical protein